MYVFEINPLSVASFAIIFSQSEGCLFTLLIASFAVQKLLSFIRSDVVLITVALGDHSLKSGTIVPPTLFFFLKIALAIQSSPFLILKHISNITYFCP